MLFVVTLVKPLCMSR